MSVTMARKSADPDFPCTLVIQTPFPTHRLASNALKALQVDTELSPLVRRSFTLVQTAKSDAASATSNGVNSETQPFDENAKTVLRTEYRAKTNRMLRVAVNGFMESLGVVLGVMERLDVDIMSKKA